jgi:sulfide:quinone oxidoreductase
MGRIDSADSPVQVLLGGGGFASLETILALRELLGGRASITLVSPDPHLAYRPAATLEAFVEPEHSSPDRSRNPCSYDLRAICEDLGVTYRHDRLEAVAPKQHRVRLASFARLPYDVLVLALGARATVAVPGALTFRDQRDVPQFQRLLAAVRAGEVDQLVFAVPSGCTWALPLYELALMTAAFAKRHHVHLDVSLVSPEAAPLELFGGQASELLAGVLADRGVRFRGSSVPASVRADGALLLHFNGAIKADRVVCAPQLHGPRITGLPSDWWGFLATDSSGRVEGLSDVYAAGDMTAFPIKQGGLAAQQADLIAHDIASRHGITVGAAPKAHERVLRARLIGGAEQLLLRVALDENAHPLRASLQVETLSSPAAPGSFDADEQRADAEKVFGRHLTSYLRERQPLAAAS